MMLTRYMSRILLQILIVSIYPFNVWGKLSVLQPLNEITPLGWLTLLFLFFLFLLVLVPAVAFLEDIEMDVPKWPSTKIDPKIIPIFGKNITSFDNIIPNFVEQPINLIIWIFRFVRQPYFFLFKVIPMTVNLRIEAVIAKVLIFIFSFESPIDGLQRRKFEFMLDLSEIRYLQSEWVKYRSKGYLTRLFRLIILLFDQQWRHPSLSEDDLSNVLWLKSSIKEFFRIIWANLIRIFQFVLILLVYL